MVRSCVSDDMKLVPYVPLPMLLYHCCLHCKNNVNCVWRISRSRSVIPKPPTSSCLEILHALQYLLLIVRVFWLMLDRSG